MPTQQTDCRQKGFSLFELTVVIVVIGLLILVGFRVYVDTIEDSQTKVIQFQANTFSRSAANIRGIAIATQSTKVTLDQADITSTAIYVNEYSWPANTDATMSPKTGTQTATECEQLWQAIFSNAPAAAIDSGSDTSVSDYLISAIDGQVCRYQLLRNQDEQYFFDYYLKTGTVLVSVPDN